MPHSKAKMYPAEERGLAESNLYKSRYSFNFHHYQQQHKVPFGNLFALNDDMLAAQQSLQFVADENMYLVLIPVMGSVIFTDSKGNRARLVSGFIQSFLVAKGDAFSLSNPYKNEVVNFLQLWIKNNSVFDKTYITKPAEIDLDGNNNHLTDLICNAQFTVALGKFGGRKEGVYKTKNSRNGIFTFVIDGQMEIQYRLLQSRDGMGLWEQNKIDFEALSASAILVVIEVML